MMRGVAPGQQQEERAASGPGEPLDVECPVCYQEYNNFNKCPRVLRCLHTFCTECLQRIQLCPGEASEGPRALPCPLCRHPTPLDGGDALALPLHASVLARLPPAAAATAAALHLPAGLATLTQRVVLSLVGEGRDARYIILPTVSLQVQQMHPDRPYGVAPGLASEDEVIEQSKKTLFCVQVLAIVFWVLFVAVCLVGVLFGPHFLNRNF